MKTKILVAYATKYGSTEEIAQKISEVLKNSGMEVTLSEASEIKSIDNYNTIVLGSAVYVGSWRKQAARFLKKFQDELKDKKVYLFSSGPTGEGDPVSLMEGWEFPKNLKEIADKIGVEDIKVFHGAVDPDKLSGLHKFMVSKIKAPVGDFRNWEDIERWSRKVIE